ncbi:MAG: outer rane biosis protein BamB [Planctomycetaceae bacterium]|nr:outer rane biosis protein BamB [Planctomycetaceae bacterium]
MTTLYRCLACFILLAGSNLSAEDWSDFRGPQGDGHATAKGLPTVWSETKNVRWKADLPGEGFSTPVILEGRLWMTTATNEGKSFRILCVDQASGKLLHDLELFTTEKPQEKHKTNSYASPSCVLEPGRVYVHFGTYGTACLDSATAKVLWKQTDLHCDHEVGPGSSPVLWKDFLFLNYDGIDQRFVVALNKTTGQPAWKTERSSAPNASASMRKAFATPLVIEEGGRSLLINPGADRVIAYDAATGKEIWFVEYNGFSNVPRPVFGKGLAFICTGYMKPQLWAVRTDGKGNITESHVAWKSTKQIPAKPSPVLIGDELYFVSDQGVVTCLNAQSGKEVWQDRVGGNFSASPITADGHIYLIDEDGTTTVLKPGKSKEVLATNKLNEGCMASPAVSGRALFLRTRTKLYRIEDAAMTAMK